MATTYNNLYLDLRTELRRAGDEEATQSARELVCAAAAKTREELVRDGSLYASPEVEKSARELVKRHLAGEPVAYLIGEWEFYGLPLDISPAVLIPRPDTEVLATKLIDAARGAGACRILDLCAGSGCIGLAAAANLPNARVLLGEYDEEALKICRQNIRRSGLLQRGFERLDQLGRQVSHEADGIDVGVQSPVLGPGSTHRSVERGEQGVLDQLRGTGETIRQ